MKHIAKLRNKNEYWQLVGSQGVQDIIQRIDINASKNIKRAGSLSLGLDGVRQSQTATVA